MHCRCCSTTSHCVRHSRAHDLVGPTATRAAVHLIRGACRIVFTGSLARLLTRPGGAGTDVARRQDRRCWDRPHSCRKCWGIGRHALPSGVGADLLAAVRRLHDDGCGCRRRRTHRSRRRRLVARRVEFIDVRVGPALAGANHVAVDVEGVSIVGRDRDRADVVGELRPRCRCRPGYRAHRTRCTRHPDRSGGSACRRTGCRSCSSCRRPRSGRRCGGTRRSGGSPPEYRCRAALQLIRLPPLVVYRQHATSLSGWAVVRLARAARRPVCRCWPRSSAPPRPPHAARRVVAVRSKSVAHPSSSRQSLGLPSRPGHSVEHFQRAAMVAISRPQWVMSPEVRHRRRVGAFTA